MKSRGRSIRLWLLIAIALVGIGKAGYIHAKAVLAQYLLESAWQQTRREGGQIRPWPWADTWPLARLEVPGLGVEQIVLSGTSGRVLAFGPGHITGTALPGEFGTTVLSGHRDTHFQWLRDLQPGGRIELEMANGDSFAYRVIEAAVYDENETGLLQSDGRALLRLVTCYPFDTLIPGGAQRFVVSAERGF